jgi:hypothetical protein
VSRIKLMTLTTISACLLSVVVAASASAAFFHASKTGKLVGKQTGTQTFNTGSGAVECTKAASSGTATALLVLSQLIQTTYTGCTAFSFAEVKINTADYLFNADKGLVLLDNTLKIEVPLAGCSVTVPPQDLFTVTYDNKSGKLLELTNVHSIKSTGSGGLCGGSNSSGTYVGNNELELTGGELSWG